MLGGALIGGLTSMLGSWSNNLFNSLQASHNREFQSSEAEKQRKWSAAEAEQARAWQEEMYAKYNSLQGKVSQAELAGVNPLFAVTGNSVTPMNASSSVPSGAAATGGSMASASLFDLAEAVLSGSKLKAEIDLLKAQKEKTEEEAKGQRITNEDLKEMNVTDILAKRADIDYTVENTQLVSSRILNTKADTEKKMAELGQIAASISNMNADTDVKVQQLAVMLTEINLNNAKITNLFYQDNKLIAEFNNLVQQFGHNEVINAINEISLSRDTGTGDYSNGYYRSISEVKRFISSLLGWFSGGVSMSKVVK